MHKYRNNHVARLQTIAEKLEYIFAESSPETKNQFFPSKLPSYELSDFPISIIPKDIVQKLEPFVKSSELGEEEKMCLFLLTTLLNQESNPSRGIGIKLLLQILLKNSPELIEVTINELKKEFKKKKGETNEASKNILLYVFWQLVKGSDPSYSLFYFIHFIDIFLSISNKDDVKRILTESIPVSDKPRHFLLDKDGIITLIQSTAASSSPKDKNASVKDSLSHLLLNIIKTEPNSDKYTETLISSLSVLLASDNKDSDLIDVYRKCISHVLLGKNGFKIWGNQYVKNFEATLAMLEYIHSNNLIKQYDNELVTKFLNNVVDKNESALLAKYGDRTKHRAGLQKKDEKDLQRSNYIATQLLRKYGITRQTTKSKPSLGPSEFLDVLSLVLMFIAMVGLFYLSYQVSKKTNVMEQFLNSTLVHSITTSPYYHQFINFTKPYYDLVMQYVTPLWNQFLHHFNPLYDQASTQLLYLWEQFLKHFIPLYNEAKVYLLYLWDQFLKHFIPIYNQTIEYLKPLCYQLMVKMESVYNELMKYVQQLIGVKDQY